MASRSSGMPPTGVYLVKLALMARLAASLTCDGVGKSGSPAPKDTTLIPARCISLALASTAMVADGAMRRARSASFTGGISLLTSDGQAEQPSGPRWWSELLYRAYAIRGDTRCSCTVRDGLRLHHTSTAFPASG